MWRREQLALFLKSLPMADKLQFQQEFLIKSSTQILYNCLSTPSGLSEWFCDDVNIKGDQYNFMWDGSEEVAKLLTKRKGEFIRFQWMDDEDTDYFFEMKIVIDPITKEVALVITDFAEEDEMEESRLLWSNQVDDLKHTIGG